MTKGMDRNLKSFGEFGEFVGVEIPSAFTELEKQYKFQSLQPTYNLPFAIVGDDQLLEGVVTVSIFVPLFVLSTPSARDVTGEITTGFSGVPTGFGSALISAIVFGIVKGRSLTVPIEIPGASLPTLRFISTPGSLLIIFTYWIKQNIFQ